MGRPTQKSLRQMLVEWIDFRMETVAKRTRHRWQGARPHPWARRAAACPAQHRRGDPIIRNRGRAQAALIARFKLSDRQAEDILEIRLRQFWRGSKNQDRAGVEGAARRAGQARRHSQPAPPAASHRGQGIESDAKQYGDDRRTLIQTEKKAVAEVKVIDEPVTWW